VVERGTVRTDVDSGETAPMKSPEDVERYLRSCRTEFWQGIFRAEVDYLLEHLRGSKDVLSVGCGPAIIESALTEHGFRVTGLDVSQEALDRAPDRVRAVVARAEDMPFAESSFDAVIYVASLQFIEDYRKAIEKTAHVLRPGGRLVVMLLNPKSPFFGEQLRDPNSYVHGIRHTKIHEIESATAEMFHIHTEYFMGVEEGNVFESRDAAEAALYTISGIPKSMKQGGEV
jgi:ubiquinone/menaquinone biosynthesis C-methylase UbiE